MKRFAIIAIFLAIILSTSACIVSINSTDKHQPADTVYQWETALEYLTDGNERYLSDKSILDNSNAEVREQLKDGQYPFAVIVTCSDSRVPPEILFDQTLGDIFVIRNAGNIADSTALGSIEYAVEHLGVPLVVVLGHSHCGAVTGAFEGGEFPENLQTIIDTITPLIGASTTLESAIKDNIAGSAQCVKSNEIIHEMGTKVVGAFYDIESGEVDWLD